MNGTATRCPTRQPRTSGPTSTMLPDTSWPGTCGGVMSESWPCQPCQSLRHRPVASTRSSTPSGGTVGSGSSTTAGGWRNCSYRTARIGPLYRIIASTGASLYRPGALELLARPAAGRVDLQEVDMKTFIIVLIIIVVVLVILALVVLPRIRTRQAEQRQEQAQEHLAESQQRA